MAKNNKTDLLIFSSEFPPGPGGLGELAFQTANSLHRKGLKIFVICNQDYASSKEVNEFNCSQPFEIKSFSSGHNPLLNLWKKYWAFRKIYRGESPKVVLSSGVTPSLICMVYGCFHPIRLTTVIHGPEFQVFFRHQNWLINFLLNRSKLFAVSHYSKDYLIQNGYKKSIEVINNSAHKHEVDDLKQLALLQEKYRDKKVLLTVGRMYYRKGQEFVIRSLPLIKKKYPNVCYILIGHEEKKAYLQKIAEDLNVKDHIDFVGQISKQQLGYYHSICDVYLLMSQNLSDGDFEGFGISIIEAAFHGKPAIGSKNCGIADAIVHGKTGFLLEDSKPETIAKAVEDFFDNPDKVKQMGQQAKLRAEREFTWDKYADKFMDYLEETFQLRQL